MLTNYYWPHPHLAGQIQYFGKGPGFEFYDLIKLALVEYENGSGGGGGGGKGGGIRNETRFAEVALRFLILCRKHRFITIQICPTPRVRLGNMSLMRAVCFANS